MADHIAILGLGPRRILTQLEPIMEGGLRATFFDLDTQSESTETSVDDTVIARWKQWAESGG